MSHVSRRGLFLTLGAIGAASLPFVAARAENWYDDRARRAQYEHWREAEMRRQREAAEHAHRHWADSDWHEQHELDAWARQQSWYR
jgi:hypothetical protein